MNLYGSYLFWEKIGFHFFEEDKKIATGTHLLQDTVYMRAPVCVRVYVIYTYIHIDRRLNALRYTHPGIMNRLIVSEYRVSFLSGDHNSFYINGILTLTFIVARDFSICIRHSCYHTVCTVLCACTYRNWTTKSKPEIHVESDLLLLIFLRLDIILIITYYM